MKGAVPATVGVLLASSGFCGDGARSALRTVVPAVEVIDPTLAAPALDCDPALVTPPARGCAIGPIGCGSVVEGNNQSGRAHWGDDFYQRAFCTPQRHHYDQAPEVVWELQIPPNTRADVHLDAPCADLDLVSMGGWQDPTACPTDQHTGRLSQCEMSTERGRDTVTITTVDRSEVHLVGVDGKNGATGNFRITVACRDYR